MADEGYILKELKRYWGDRINEADGNVPYDFTIYTTQNEVFCYVVVKSHIEQEEKVYLQDIANKIKSVNIIPAPCILIKVADMNFEVGILSYWEYGRYIYNRDINWRPLNEETLEWLRIQLQAKRMTIRFLPDKFFRFLKVIRLNATTLTEAEIVYFRRFSETYKMRTKFPMTDIERFNRLLKGTPEDEYPKDELDDLILKNVQKYYPSASVKSRSLLCETELLDLRLYKDKWCNKDFLAFKDSFGDISQITLECYYYPNFRYFSYKPKVSNMDIVPIKDRKNCESYEPLSAMNI